MSLSLRCSGTKLSILTSVNSFFKSNSLANINNFLPTSLPFKSSLGSGSVKPLSIVSCKTSLKGLSSAEKVLKR